MKMQTTVRGLRFHVVATCTLFPALIAVTSPSRIDCGEGEEEDNGATPFVDIDTEYVKEHLESYLKPTTISFSPDGRVRLSFDFQEKNEEQSQSFVPPISKDAKKAFRWTNRADETPDYYDERERFKGLRLGNGGVALLKCWFRDDVQVELDYVQLRTHLAKQIVAPVFYTTKQRALGSNFGQECIVLRRNKPQKRKGRVEPILIDETQQLRLTVTGGVFEASRGRGAGERAPYKPELFASGRVGLAWSGGIAGVVLRLRVEGTIDTARMAQELRERSRR